MDNNFEKIKNEIIKEVGGKWDNGFIRVAKETNDLGDKKIMFCKYYNLKTLKIRLYMYNIYLEEIEKVCKNNLGIIKRFGETSDGSIRPCFDIVIWRNKLG